MKEGGRERQVYVCARLLTGSKVVTPALSLLLGKRDHYGTHRKLPRLAQGCWTSKANMDLQPDA